MADRMQDVFPIVFNFKRGEQPSSTKLTKWVQLEDIGFDKITLAVGDPWDYQTHTSGSTAYTLSPENLSQPSIARIIGPSDYISPTASFNEGKVGSLVATLVANKTTWNLGIPLVTVSSSSPVTPSSTYTVGNGVTPLDYTDLTFSDPTTFALSQTSITDVNATGDYYVDFYRGVVTSYSAPTSSSTLTISSDLHIFGAGSPWSTQNVIPTWNDGTVGCYVELLLDNGDGTYTYQIDVPSVVNYPRANSASSVNATGLVAGSTSQITYSTNPLAAGSSYRLPYSIVSNLSSGDTVPSGYCYLWSNTDETIIPAAVFVYRDAYQLYITCPQLTGIGTVVGDSSSTEYRLVINGASLAEQVNWLTRAYRDTWHDGLTWGGTTASTLNYSTPLSHDNLYDRYSWSEVSGASVSSEQSRLYFTESSYPTNCHPQYLHRYGYMGSETTGNSCNAMRGDLVLTNTFDYDFSLSSYYETYSIKFGSGATTASGFSLIGGEDISTWLSGSGAALRVPFRLSGTGGNELDEREGGAIAYNNHRGTPFYIRGNWGSLGGGSYSAYRGGAIAFDIDDWMEASYIKVFPASRSGSYDAYNMPANTGQASSATTSTCPGLAPTTTNGGTLDPASFNRLSPDQVREFRFRGVSYVSTSSNADDSLGGEVLRGVGSGIEEFEKYFTSPGMVGADFLNVYSNSIFFSDTGNGKTTSYTDNGESWLNTGTRVPSGIHYVPNYTGASAREPYFYFSFDNGSSATQPFKFGDDYGFNYSGDGTGYFYVGGTSAQRNVVKLFEDSTLSTKLGIFTVGASEIFRAGTYGVGSTATFGTWDGNAEVIACTLVGGTATRNVNISAIVNPFGGTGPSGDVNIWSQLGTVDVDGSIVTIDSNVGGVRIAGTTSSSFLVDSGALSLGSSGTASVNISGGTGGAVTLASVSANISITSGDDINMTVNSSSNFNRLRLNNIWGIPASLTAAFASGDVEWRDHSTVTPTTKVLVLV